ncbi:hypothetical protein SPF06_09760 [Sinomonas sp. JGH33]|uniref:Glyoxalase n=1 Tax=Sinomonas terricola TaxID=3110330 RepID=A0ABU5T5R9_9MICC|nr:hypothetical protein [Sinomonas sp. JGH33]MEA5455004.1 hypothetical protein [Sinomonas sp. JGH33]
MAIQRMDNVGIVVDDLDEAAAFFAELGMAVEGRAPIEGVWADRTVGLDGIRSDTIDRLRAHGAELLGDVVQYEDVYRLCYLRRPAGIIVALAEQIG